MDVRQAYNKWADSYDTDSNKTRDLEGTALRQTLVDIRFDTCLEIGCGTGKNTAWLINRATRVTAVDLSEEMLHKARYKLRSNKVHFVEADILKDWTFTERQYDLVTFSLVLEHIENVADILQKTGLVVRPNGYVYIGELHPFKQYTGAKARFDTEEGRHVVPCFTHHVSDFTQSADDNGFDVVSLREYFDDDDRNSLPRILAILLKKR